MSLNQYQITKAKNWLNQKAPNHICSSCHANNWHLGDIFAPTVVYHGKDVDIGGNCRPMLQVICIECGKVELFDATNMGLI